MAGTGVRMQTGRLPSCARPGWSVKWTFITGHSAQHALHRGHLAAPRQAHNHGTQRHSLNLSTCHLLALELNAAYSPFITSQYPPGHARNSWSSIPRTITPSHASQPNLAASSEFSDSLQKQKLLLNQYIWSAVFSHEWKQNETSAMWSQWVNWTNWTLITVKRQYTLLLFDPCTTVFTGIFFTVLGLIRTMFYICNNKNKNNNYNNNAKFHQLQS